MESSAPPLWAGADDADSGGDLVCSPQLKEDDDGQTLFEIIEDSRDSGDDIVLCTSDADEAAYWIAEQISEKEE